MLYLMRVDYLVLLLHVERLELRRSSHFLHGVVSSVLPLVVCMHTLGVVIADHLINHLPSSRPAHEMLVILNIRAHLPSYMLRERVSSCSPSIVVIVFVLNKLRWVLRSVADSVRVLSHYQLLLRVDLWSVTSEILSVGRISLPLLRSMVVVLVVLSLVVSPPVLSP